MIVGWSGRGRRLGTAWGSPGPGARALARLGVRRAVLYERRPDHAADGDGKGPFRHDWAGPTDVERLALASGRTPRDELGRLAGGERCFATFLDGVLVGFRWVSEGRVHAVFLGIDLVLPDGDVWVSDSWVDPAVRGRGASSAATRALGGRLAAEGARRTLAVVMVGNRAGHAALAGVGYGALGTITTVRTRHGRAVRFRRASRDGGASQRYSKNPRPVLRPSRPAAT